MTNPWKAAALLAAVFGSLLGGGCGSTSAPPTGDLRLDLGHEDPRIRAQAAKAAVEGNRRDVIPLLVANLSHPDGAVRMFSAIALRKLTGEDRGYRPYDSPEERERAVAAWKAWADSQEPPARGHAGTGPHGAAGPASVPPGTGAGTTRFVAPGGGGDMAWPSSPGAPVEGREERMP